LVCHTSTCVQFCARGIASLRGILYCTVVYRERPVWRLSRHNVS
jgi:hypothetical protein